MQISKERKEDRLEWALSGRLDTVTAPQLQEAVKTDLEGVRNLTIDMAALEYITSAGLRVLLQASKKLGALGGTVAIQNANKEIREVFKITGFDTILHVQ
ncbi:MAG: STAS domain-containing protein [Lachnospiraceae bacterium]|nr:STAS domain-containing protein [Lachnospiraceae bacterium]